MGWSTPATWVAGTVVTANDMNTYIRDQQRYLKGIGQVPTIESGLTIDNTDGDERLLLPLLSTAECATVLNAAGEVAYDEATNRIKMYGTTLNSVVTTADVDDTPADAATTDPISSNWAYDFQQTLTTAGDIPYATDAGVWARLAKGTANQYFKMNSGATAPEWGTVATVHNTGTFQNNTDNGDQAITGVGFQPSVVIVWCESGGYSIAIYDATSQIAIIYIEGALVMHDTKTLQPYTDGSNHIDGHLKQMDADGFTITWSGDTGTAPQRTYSYIAFS